MKNSSLNIGDKVYVLSNLNSEGKYTNIRIDYIEDIYNENNTNMVSFRYIWHDTELSDLGVNFFKTEKEAKYAIENNTFKEYLKTN